MLSFCSRITSVFHLQVEVVVGTVAPNVACTCVFYFTGAPNLQSSQFKHGSVPQWFLQGLICIRFIPALFFRRVLLAHMSGILQIKLWATSSSCLLL